MIRTHVWSKPPPEYCERLREFELQFDYPLTDTARFRIEHSLEYERFFSTLGESLTVVVESGGTILGVLSSVIRTLRHSRGELEKWLYIGDVKIDPSARSGHVLKRLFLATRTWVGEKCTKGYSVVMEGTGVTPGTYTGRIGIPQFRPVQSVTILGLKTESLRQFPIDSAKILTSNDPHDDCEHLQRTQAHGRAPQWSMGNRSIRSRMKLVWLSDPSTGCTGLLEDTRGSKRLYDDNSEELLYAHLSSVQYRSPKDLIPIVVEAGRVAYDEGLTNLLVAIPATECSSLSGLVENTQHEVLSSTVYATDQTEGLGLPISSSEI